MLGRVWHGDFIAGNITLENESDLADDFYCACRSLLPGRSAIASVILAAASLLLLFYQCLTDRFGRRVVDH